MTSILDYEKIQLFKASRGAVIGGVNYARVVAPYLYEKSLSGLFKKIIFSLFFITRISVRESNENGLLLYYSCRHKRRSDYDYIVLRLRQLLGNHCEYIESKECFSLFQVWCTLNEFPKAWHSSKGYPVNMLQRVGSALLIAKYCSTANRVFPTLLKNKNRVVTFCDAQAPENLLAQMSNLIGVETFTNQHGQYRMLDASNISSDAEVYANFVSDYILCWGEATRKEFIKAGFRPEQLIVAGWIKQWEAIASHPRLGVFGVMLNGENGRESNAALLDAAKFISKKLGLRYLVRLHPWSHPKQYAEYLDDRCAGIGHYRLYSYLEKVDFSLAHMTGATIEMLHANMPVYLLDDGRLCEAFCVEGLSFSTPEAIMAAVSEDAKSPDLATQRTQRLAKWFNDDHAQSIRICTALLD